MYTAAMSTAETVTEYFAAIRAMDVERCVAVFAPNAEQHDPMGTPPNVGHDAIRAFFTHIFSGFKTTALTEVNTFISGNAAAVKWDGTGETKSGKSVTFEGIDVLTCDDNGKIVLVQAFWDPSPVMAAMQG